MICQQTHDHCISLSDVTKMAAIVTCIVLTMHLALSADQKEEELENNERSEFVIYLSVTVYATL